MKRLLTAGVASLVLVAGQAAASAPSLTQLGMADRAASPSQVQNEMFGLSPLVIGLILAGIIVVVVVATDDDDPSSP
jgi:hypothetical protein